MYTCGCTCCRRNDINEVGDGVNEVGEILRDIGFGLILRGDSASAITITGSVVGCNDVGDFNVVDGGGDGVACFVGAGESEGIDLSGG